MAYFVTFFEELFAAAEEVLAIEEPADGDDDNPVSWYGINHDLRGCLWGCRTAYGCLECQTRVCCHGSEYVQEFAEEIQVCRRGRKCQA